MRLRISERTRARLLVPSRLQRVLFWACFYTFVFKLANNDHANKILMLTEVSSSSGFQNVAACMHLHGLSCFCGIVLGYDRQPCVYDPSHVLKSSTECSSDI